METTQSRGKQAIHPQLILGPGGLDDSKKKRKGQKATCIAKAIAAEGEVSGAEDTAGNSAVEFPIVGIGASAGGLAAFEAFSSGMPAITEPGMAFVLVQHLAPDHKSILTDLIRRYTHMQVLEVEDGMMEIEDSRSTLGLD
jgi:two-component system, chemotaxis family, CheB/CheR fusion protein